MDASVQVPSTAPAEESIPRALVPWNRDDDKSRYLGLRSSGFTIREALNLLGKAKSTLSFWRKDPKFVELEERLPELRKELAMEYVALETLRNYRLVLEKDFRVLKRSLTTQRDEDGKIIPMGNADQQYLNKMRTMYHPQQLQALEQLLQKDSQGNNPFNFTDFVLTLSRTKEEVKIESRQHQETGLSRLTDDSDIIDGEIVGEKDEEKNNPKNEASIGQEPAEGSGQSN